MAERDGFANDTSTTGAPIGRGFTALDRRSADRPEDDIEGRRRRKLSFQEMAALITIVVTIGTLLLGSWRAYDSRLDRVELRVDTLFTQLRFTNYLQCVQLRKNDPASLPPDCAPIERAWAERPR